MAVSSFVKKRTKIEVTGIVQGVGFRPFVYRHALLHSLSGYTLNNGGGVLIEVEGDELHISKFLETLKNAAPTLSRVDALVSFDIPLQDSDGFTILESQTRTLNTMIPVDISICSDCQKEMQDPQNRRYQHPFINCLNCGPRYSVIDSLPYDRKNTSMQTFDMCDECRSEYEEPSSRRFHAQAISCPKCGPKLSENTSIKRFTQLIKEGKPAAIKGIGGFHILCDASNVEAVQELRLHKNRPKKPLAVMFKNLASIKEACSLSREEEVLILSRERPIVLVRKKKNSLIAESVAPNIDKIGVFLAYTPLHELLLNELDCPIVATSANVSGEPIIRDEKELLNRLPFVTQSVLTHDREILNSCDDSVVMSVEGESVMLRLGRGYAPKSFYRAKKITKKILALGANQKSTITMAFDNHLILSPHIGDLNSIEAFEYFVRTLETFKRFYSFEPDIIVCDKHPGYETTKWAKDYVAKNPNIELLEVQHHYAHALACMAEHDLEGEALAFCFDGTGYGENEEGNASLWGGEVLRVTPREYKREYHLGEFSLLGGEKATGEPRRVALGLLFECYS
ncbi:MAG: carbamoyltransferase HypF, partial [Campylobacterota bacterium]|nr:carbamoyltransferase HypF [Campylobacterota bacterium]